MTCNLVKEDVSRIHFTCQILGRRQYLLVLLEIGKEYNKSIFFNKMIILKMCVAAKKLVFRF